MERTGWISQDVVEKQGREEGRKENGNVEVEIKAKGRKKGGENMEEMQEDGCRKDFKKKE